MTTVVFDLGGVVVRWDKGGEKTIRPVSRVAGGWTIGAMPEPRPLYSLTEIPAAQTVFVCEGEKAADAIRELGLVATTSSGGSAAAAKTDWKPLAGKAVVILPDNDGPGQKYANEVQAILAALKKHDFNRTETARALGISRRALIYKLQKFREMGFEVDGLSSG